MAKLVAPLFSFSARGQLAKTLVYSGWKGIDDVRSYAVPANPRSSGQQTQRGYFTESVDAWHNTGLTADDIEAWNRWANTLPRPQSGFNAFCAAWMNYRVAGVSQANMAMGFNGGIADSGVGQVDFTVEEDGSATAVAFHWGYTPTALINVEAGSEVANVWSANNVAVASNAIVYMKAYISMAGPTPNGETGIYRFGPTS